MSKLGKRFLEEFESPQGLDLLQRALSLDPNHRPSHQILARYYEKNQQPELASRHRQLSAGAPEGRGQ